MTKEFMMSFDELKKEYKVGSVSEIDGKKYKVVDKLDQGYVTESNVSYKRITYMRPVKHDYSDDEHPNYYKYSCPVCDILGNRHQVTVGDTNCPLCNVNLLWKGYFD